MLCLSIYMWIMCLVLSFNSIVCNSQLPSDVASSYFLTAISIKETTGDLWVAEKLLSSCACMAPNNKTYFLALGDVEMELGRPLEALLAWKRAASIDGSLKRTVASRIIELRSETSENRWRMDLLHADSSSWNCPALGKKISTPVISNYPDITTKNLFSTPVIFVNITAMRESAGDSPIDHQEILETAVRGFNEANRQAYYDNITPNNAFFDWQMVHETAASLRDFTQHLTGWKDLASSTSWRRLLKSLRETIEMDEDLRQYLIDGRGYRNAYGWLSLHTPSSTHVAHAHLDARLGGIYYVQVPPSANHSITFYDPRGISPHQNLRLPDGLSAPPFRDHFTYFPKAGELILFPAWLVHSVDSFGPASPCGLGSGATCDLGDGIRHIDVLSDIRVSASFNIGEGWERSS